MSITKTKKKNSDGIYLYRVRVSYQDRTGIFKQKEKSVYGLQLAKDTEYLLKKDTLHADTSPQLTLALLIEEYYNVKKYEIRENSIRTTKNRIDTYILPFIGQFQISKLDTKALTRWKLDIEKLGLSHITKKNAYGELRSLLNFAVKMDYINQNPLTKVGNFKTSEISKNNIQVYSTQDFAKYINVALADAVESNCYDYYVFFNIAFYTGMRKGEIHALRWSSLENNTLSVKSSIQQKIKGCYLETPPKNKSSIRNVKIPTPLIDILREHKLRQENNDSFSEDNYICGMVKPLPDTSIDNKNRLYAANASLYRIRIHDFRHTHASILIDNGLAITEIARRLGHSDIKETLNTYAHFFPYQEDKAIEILNSL